MTCPQHLEISLDTVFTLFNHQDEQIITHSDILCLLNFAFKQLGMSRTADQYDLSQFLIKFNLTNSQVIKKSDFCSQKYINFRRISSNPTSIPSCPNPSVPTQISIPIQPLLNSIQSSGCTIISKQQIRNFLNDINMALNIDKIVEDQEVQQFVKDFDQNQDGQLETHDLKHIQALRFNLTKCRRYA